MYAIRKNQLFRTSLSDLRWGAISLVSVHFFLPWVFRILQVELEAENWWLDSISHDLSDEKHFVKTY